MSTALSQPSETTMSVEEFLAWAADRDGRWELLDGVPLAMAPGSDAHGSIQAELARLLGNELARARPDCRVVTEGGVVPALSAHDNFRVPDLVVTCSPQSPGRHHVANPILIIEIMSPSNRAQTWTNVWAYSTIPSVQEIVVVQSERIEAAVLQRAPDGSWPDAPDAVKDGAVLTLPSILFEVAMRAVYRTTLLA